MARTKEFDPDIALQRALELFWTRGYEATSMADLVAHLGIARASLYATFGGKHDLYLRALERYVTNTNAAIVTALSKPGPVLPAVRDLVASYAAQSLDDPDRRGCMVVNAAVEIMPRDPQAARQVEAGWDTLETVLRSALTRARAQGELRPDADPAALARFLFVVLQGIRVLGRADPAPARVHDAAELALGVLR